LYNNYVGYNYNSTSIRRPFDGHSAAYERSLRSQWCNTLAVVTLTCLLIQVAARQPGRDVDCGLIVVPANCSRTGVRRQSSRRRTEVES